ncbi:MAG: DUF6263 family protein [Pirellulaceae bacterium]|nr:DUF6263 family protein [Pirellulaceae bacterium]
MHRFSVVSAIAIGLFAGMFSGELAAQTLLRWQLAEGDSLALSVRQETQSVVVFSGKETKTTIDLTMELGWQVTAASEDILTVKQKVKRIVLKLNSPAAGAIEFDSQAQANLIGPARTVAATVSPLVGAEIEITLDRRGQVTGVKPLGEAAEKLLAGGKDDEGAGSAQAIQQLLRQPLAILPEKPVAIGDSWTTTSDLAAAVGKFQQEIVSTLAGEVEEGGQKLLKIDQKWTLTPADPAAKPKLTLKSHQQTGTLLFAAAAGRLASAEQTQKLVTERPYRETTIVVTLSSTQQTTVKAVPKP